MVLWAVTVAAALALAAPAAAAPTWLAPENISGDAPQGSHTTDIAMNNRGDAVAAWFGYDAASAALRVFAAHRKAGGPWGSPQLLSGANGFNPVTAVDGQGRPFVAWSEAGIVKLAVGDASGTFGAADSLSASGASSPQIALDSAGAAVVVWLRNGVVEYLTRSSGGTFSPPAGAQPLSDAAGGAHSFTLAMGAAGDIALAWIRNSAVEVRYRRAGDADFGGVQTPGAPQANIYYSMPKMALDKDGRATLVYIKTDANTSPSTRTLQTVERTRTIPFGTGVAAATAPSGESFSAPDIGVDGSGTATVTWYHALSGGLRIEASSKPQGGSFGAIQLVSASSGSADFPEIKVNDDGDVLIVWNRYVPPIATRVIEAKYRPSGSTFDAQPVRMLSSEADYSDFPDAAIDGAGNGVAFWGRRNTTSPFTWSFTAAGLDAAAPTFSDVAVPGSARAKQAVPMSVAAFDQWANPSIAWNFGDGEPEVGGASTSHAYAAPGTYTVTVTATDGASNTSTVTRTVQVGPADEDADGSPATVDCNDQNPNVKPGAPEIAGNGVDEDCDGADAAAAVGSADGNAAVAVGSADGTATAVTPRVDPGIDARWIPLRRHTRVASLAVLDVRPGYKIRVTCKGKGCKFSSRTVSVRKVSKRQNLTKFFNFKKKGKKVVSKLRRGAKVRIAVTAPGHIGKHWQATVRAKGKPPKTSATCLAVDSATVRVACPGAG